VATLVEVVALSALSVSRWVRQGRPSRPWFVRVGEFLYESQRGRWRPVYIQAWPMQVYPCGWILNFDLSFRRFSGRGFLGGLPRLVAGFKYL
jgi:hypothetical protein